MGQKIQTILDNNNIQLRIPGTPGDGWADIVERLVEDLKALGWDGQLGQIKEKFGGLRFYAEGNLDWDTKAAWNRIRQAEKESYETCEVCGEPGKLIDNGWVYVRCERHAVKDT